MSALGKGASLARPDDGHASALGELVLVRALAGGGATRSEIVSDLAPWLAHKLSPADWRRRAGAEIDALVARGLAAELRGRITPSDEGIARASAFLGGRQLAGAQWPLLRDVHLVARALGLEGESAAKLKQLARPEGLRSLIVQKSFGLPLKKNQPPAKLRAQLAVVALERAFGNKIKAGLGKTSALPAKAGRLLAGQLSVAPREHASDAKLIAELAAEQVGAVRSDLDTVRLAIHRKLAAALLSEEIARAGTAPRAAPASPPLRIAAIGPSTPAAANDRGPSSASVMRVAAARPGLPEFAAAVKNAAAACAEGWPGNRKAYISAVWSAIRDREPRWGLTEIEFKCMLAEAHRAGALVLANADLKTKSRLTELESSAVPYKNTVWHFVRVED